MQHKLPVTRRLFLAGIGGVTVGLPFLEGLQPRKLRAAPPVRPRFAVFVRQANGCQQALNAEPERFWPSKLGPVTNESLMGIDNDRAVAELAEFAEKLLLVRGTHFNFKHMGCSHAAGGNQLLTAAKFKIPNGAELYESRAMGESVDNRIARELNGPANTEPLTLYAGPMAAGLREVLSYRGPGELRAANSNPWDVYENMLGITQLPDELIAQIKARRISVNDLLREQMAALMSKPALSQADRSRLQLHFDAIRDIEVELACNLPPDDEIAAMKEQQDYAGQDDLIQVITKMQMNLIAFAFACDYTRAATLQIGAGSDGTQWRIDDEKLPSYHFISHRMESNGSMGEPIPDAVDMHHRIDREHGKLFLHLLKRLNMVTTNAGTLLDDTVAVWCNDLGTGVDHSFNNIPWVCAGSCGGILKTGQYIDAGDVTHNKFHNTILSAVGLTNAEGGFVDDFGDPELDPGVIDAMIAV